MIQKQHSTYSNLDWVNAKWSLLLDRVNSTEVMVVYLYVNI